LSILPPASLDDRNTNIHTGGAYIVEPDHISLKDVINERFRSPSG